MQIINNKALLLRLKNPGQVLNTIPNSKQVSDHEVVVKWGVPEVHTLQQLNIKAPSPISAHYAWPGKFKPMAHQRTTAEFLTKHQRAFCFNEQGTGKTASAAWAADYLMQQGIIKRALIICPVSIMSSAWRADLFSCAMHRTVDIAYGSAKKRKEILATKPDFLIINYDGVEVIKEELAEAGYDLIIVDECFVAGTPVHTPAGLKGIETLKAGDTVLTSSGARTIKTASSRKPKQLVEVSFSDGSTIKCTPEHPFFTDCGWVPAKALAGRRVISAADMPYLRSGIQSEAIAVGVPPETWHGHRHDLLEILRTEEMAFAEPRQVSAQEPDAGTTGDCRTQGVYAVGGTPGAYVGCSETAGVSPSGAWGEWQGDDQRGSSTRVLVTPELDMELPHCVGVEAARLSYELQSRLRVARQENSPRGGRQLTQNAHRESTGHQENHEVVGTWVDCVTYTEPRSDELVYNIEVSGTPNYFVGSGYLVHNCTHYKNSQSKRWKTLKKLVTPNTWLWMMTGTPAAQGAEDAYGLAKLVNPTAVPQYFNTWKDMVSVQVSRFRWEPRKTATEHVHRVLQPAIRFTKDECLDLPDMVYTKRHVNLTNQQKKFYEELRKQMYAEVIGEQITAVNAAVGMNKLLQISAGAVYTDDGETVHFDIKNRYSVLKEVIDESTHKVLVFVPYRNTIDLLKEKLDADGVTTEVIRGDVSPAKRTDIFERFQKQKDPHVLLIQPQSAAHGVTLTAANTVVWWSPTPSLETYAQANARVHRSGQKNKCTVVQLAGSPVERRIYKLLDGKIDVHTELVNLYKNLLD